MKKIILPLLALLALGSTLQAQPVYSNIVGMYKVPKIAGGLQLLGVSIGDDTTLSQLIDISQFTGSFFTAGADKIIAFDPSTQSYTTYAKYDNSALGGDVVAWRLESNFNGANVDPVLPPGSAVFIKAVAGTDSDIIVSGDVPVTETTSIEIIQGLQMISLPFTTKIDLNSADAGFISSGATGSFFTAGSDRIITWNSTTQGYVTYALYDNSALGGSIVEWRPESSFNTPASGPIEIEVGSGFWYKALNGFTWTPTNPYFNNLD
ncbi:MAG: hypothetical protein ACO3NW_09335 [Kiritimatiellia bacterium]